MQGMLLIENQIKLYVKGKSSQYHVDLNGQNRKEFSMDIKLSHT